MPPATLPLSGSETLSVMQGGILSDCTVQDIADLSGGGAVSAYEIITQSTAFTATPSIHAGLFRYIRSGGNVTFNASQPYSAGQAYNIRATSPIVLAAAGGFSLSPPSGGTLSLSEGMSVQVVMTSSTAADVIGQTVAA